MIGFGHLARRLVDLLRPFHVEVARHDPFVAPSWPRPTASRSHRLEAVLACDVVFVLVPETPSTEGMLGGAELDLLRSGRGARECLAGQASSQTAPLLARLQRGDVVGALDVFDPEPMPLDSPILDLPNVFLTPHVAGVTEESRRRFFSLMVDECLRHFDGHDPVGAHVRSGPAAKVQVDS